MFNRSFIRAVLVGALARLGATQNPIIPIYREREVGFIATDPTRVPPLANPPFAATAHAGRAKGDVARSADLAQREGAGDLLGEEHLDVLADAHSIRARGWPGQADLGLHRVERDGVAHRRGEAAARPVRARQLQARRREV